jgi:hypothetical protein
LILAFGQLRGESYRLAQTRAQADAATANKAAG